MWIFLEFIGAITDLISGLPFEARTRRRIGLTLIGIGLLIILVAFGMIVIAAYRSTVN